MDKSDFIEVYDYTLSSDICEKCITWFERCDRIGLTYDRYRHVNNTNPLDVADKALELQSPRSMEFSAADDLCSAVLDSIYNKYTLYVEKYAVLKQLQSHYCYFLKLQKTLPGEGYHKWHCEYSRVDNSNRVTAFTLYLNNVEEGGETEFLYQHRRVSPKTGRLVFWPAGFTHTHRGNPPLSSVKYIITGWMTM